jgi:hypothetical protein
MTGRALKEDLRAFGGSKPPLTLTGTTASSTEIPVKTNLSTALSHQPICSWKEARSFDQRVVSATSEKLSIYVLKESSFVVDILRLG